ncbi:MAG: AAA family ATPase [Bacteroidales bacterium]|nr:AAA family ATPase [Bacteroidales bacterium]
MLYPIGIESFEKLRSNGYTYVDKTDLIYRLVTTGTIYFLSRPRRFGKSLLLSTLKSYFSGQRDLFQGLAIEKLEQKWDKHIVLHVNFAGSDYRRLGALEEQLEDFLSHLEKAVGLTSSSSYEVRFKNIINAAREKSGRGVVVLVDEYDKPFLDTFTSDVKDENGVSLEEHNKQILRAFYSVFKVADSSLKFVMLTGITKFSQVSVFSGLNNIEDISMNPAYDSLCGLTKDELTSIFCEPIAELAEENDVSYEDMLAQLKKHYDGYHFSKKMTDIYNPFSLLSALKNKEIDNYWFFTATPIYLIRLLNRNNLNIKEIVSGIYAAEEFAKYKADSDKPLPMLYQSGYLTIKGYDSKLKLYNLDIPNDEVCQGFLTLLLQDYLQVGQGTYDLANKLTYFLRSNDLPSFFDYMKAFLASVPYTVRRKSNAKEREVYFQLTFYLILRLITTYCIQAEQITSQGRIDCLITTQTDVYIFEFKLDGSVTNALQQIEAKGYAQQFSTSGLAIHKVGVNFSSETGTIEDWAEGK